MGKKIWGKNPRDPVDEIKKGGRLEGSLKRQNNWVLQEGGRKTLKGYNSPKKIMKKGSHVMADYTENSSKKKEGGGGGQAKAINLTEQTS